MQLDYPQALDPRPEGATLWLVLAMIGIALGSAALIAALAGSGTELAGAHLALRRVCLL